MGRTILSSLGTTTQGICCCALAFSMYARSRIFSGPMGLRIEGTLPATAQSPIAISILEWARTFLIFASSSTEATAPSTRAMSTSSGKILASTMGL